MAATTGAKFWEGMTKQATHSMAERLFGPAFAFWAIGFLAYTTSRDWADVTTFLNSFDPSHEVLLVLVAGVVVVASATAMSALGRPALRLLEGYWPSWLNPIRDRLVARARRHHAVASARRRVLGDHFEELNPSEAAEYSRLDTVITGLPTANRLLPTKLGNTMRAAEDYPYRQYRLPLNVTWPRLWLVLPKDVRTAVSTVQADLYSSVQIITWSLLFLVWMIWSKWVIIASVAGMLWGYWRAIDAAQTYGALLSAAYDVHVRDLYKSLEWPDGPDPIARGTALTSYFWRLERPGDDRGEGPIHPTSAPP